MKEIANCLARDVTKETRKRLEGVKELRRQEAC